MCHYYHGHVAAPHPGRFTTPASSQIGEEVYVTKINYANLLNNSS